VVQDQWEDFLTLPAYDLILAGDEKKICEEDTPVESEANSSIFIRIEKEMAG
jgi:hypothetical protein